MSTRFVLITPDNEVSSFESNDFTDLQEAVGGMITSVPVLVDDVVPPESSVFANDEGLLIGLEENKLAQDLLGYYPLVGNIVIGGLLDDMGETLSIAPETEEAIRMMSTR